jgi:hypothetical protein
MGSVGNKGGTGGPDAARPEEHRVLDRVQPGLHDARPGQRGRNGPAVARGRPGASHPARRAAGHAGERTRTRSRSAPTSGRSRPAPRPARSSCGTCPPGPAWPSEAPRRRWPGCLCGDRPIRSRAWRSARTGGSPGWPLTSGILSALLADWWSLPTGLRRLTPPSATRVQEVGEHAPANRLPHPVGHFAESPRSAQVRRLAFAISGRVGHVLTFEALRLLASRDPVLHLSTCRSES